MDLHRKQEETTTEKTATTTSAESSWRKPPNYCSYSSPSSTSKPPITTSINNFNNRYQLDQQNYYYDDIYTDEEDNENEPYPYSYLSSSSSSLTNNNSTSSSDNYNYRNYNKTSRNKYKNKSKSNNNGRSLTKWWSSEHLQHNDIDDNVTNYSTSSNLMTRSWSVTAPDDWTIEHIAEDRSPSLRYALGNGNGVHSLEWIRHTSLPSTTAVHESPSSLSALFKNSTSEENLSQCKNEEKQKQQKYPRFLYKSGMRLYSSASASSLSSPNFNSNNNNNNNNYNYNNINNSSKNTNSNTNSNPESPIKLKCNICDCDTKPSNEQHHCHNSKSTDQYSLDILANDFAKSNSISNCTCSNDEQNNISNRKSNDKLKIINQRQKQEQNPNGNNK